MPVTVIGSWSANSGPPALRSASQADPDPDLGLEIRSGEWVSVSPDMSARRLPSPAQVLSRRSVAQVWPRDWKETQGRAGRMGAPPMQSTLDASHLIDIRQT
ncbi:hypothetical protein A1Q1_00120 [Trichosporon asahii var. asahii CBS 2479]|uniref:Uncharacterized protein n=1 Tax=Trichosporon asahii var. asahii (strain ATCC 90039 / CBS 2479 / JCM 2466 / KCTC 7840 / NBRC 103889/ NCYC 2677 / UAMH 7654) TaxID=1186058 RepID=J8QHD6_TRIAS|nr:hypothetical protein A1Q1_00120 [Trichosporon asahii var. asahii CBS 2479]EJT53113.1 hypothetical protein A1Q1_00120 [Trichosporon asahii var. asahii CBS 2479]